MFEKSIFIFRRDFRLYDNIGLIELMKLSHKVIPVFIFTPEQIVNNPYKSDNAIQFMVESLKDLEKEIGFMNYFMGKQDDIIEYLIKNDSDIQCVAINRDWTPYARKRDSEIEIVCSKYEVNFFKYEDYTLHKMGTLLKDDRTPYKVYSPFFKFAFKKKVTKPVSYNDFNFINLNKKVNINKYYKKNKNLIVKGGRKNALKILKNTKDFNQYSNKRNDLTYETTHLSAYIKFGCVSIREVYHTFKKNLSDSNQLFNQLYWKEFYVYIANYIPHVLQNKSMKLEYDKIKWVNDKKIFKKWCDGQTGFPIVDAGMRELNHTGYMHNRSRLITSGFLVKLAMVDWRWGEKYFATQLTDYDPAQNNGGWQWSSGSGADSQPYFRILSPISQSQRFDPDCEYIKKWCPELNDVENKHLHDWEKYNDRYNVDYPEPCLDYKQARKDVMTLYKKSLS